MTVEELMKAIRDGNHSTYEMKNGAKKLLRHQARKVQALQATRIRVDRYRTP